MGFLDLVQDFSQACFQHFGRHFGTRGGKDLIYGFKLGKLPLLTTFCPYGFADPKLGSWELLNQVLRFFWTGV